MVFGASGGTGLQVTKQLIEKGYDVTVALRNPSAFSLQDNNLTVCKGDVMLPDSFAEALKNKNVVISCLGNGSSLKPTTIYSEGMQNIISAMKKADIKRLICISAGALYTNQEMGVFIRFLTKAVLQKILKNIYSDMRLMESMVEKSNLEWTIVRPPMLKNKPLKGNYRIAVHSHIKRPFSIARADLAHYMVSCIANSETFKAKVEIAY